MLSAPTTRHSYLAFEGCDGAGKSTIRSHIFQAASERSIPCLLVGRHAWLHPGTSRTLLDLGMGRSRHTLETTIAAFSRDYSLLLDEVIAPALSFSNVLQDRCLLSEAVYNEVLHGVPAEETVDRYVTAKVTLPDLILYVDVEPSVAAQRVQQRGHALRPSETLERARMIVDTYHRLLNSRRHVLPPVFTFQNSWDRWQGRFDEGFLPRVMDFLSVGQVASSRRPQ